MPDEEEDGDAQVFSAFSSRSILTACLLHLLRCHYEGFVVPHVRAYMTNGFLVTDTEASDKVVLCHEDQHEARLQRCT